LQSQKPVLRQEQRLRMTPQLYQAIKIMALPLQDLRTTIEMELEKNPALEVIEDNALLSLDEEERRQNDDIDYFDDASDPGYLRSRDGRGEDSKRKFLEGMLSRPESLSEHLLWQLRLQPISGEEFRIGELLIRNLDDNGFHSEPPESLVAPSEAAVLQRLMKMIRSFEPVGTCTRDYKESLSVQMQLHPAVTAESVAVVEKYLELLERQKYPEIARHLKISVEKVLEIQEVIRELDPLPGRRFSAEAPRYVVPDIMVRLQDGEFVIILNDEEIPVLGINPLFTDISEHKEKFKGKELKSFVSANLQDARSFIRSIHQRNDTLLKVCKAIIEFQRGFFRQGPKYLVPLTLKDIAAEIGVHESTVSRATSGKYIQTEWGIYELKFFFSNIVAGPVPGGGRFSKEGVKQMMKEIIEEEDKHLTDQRISEILATKGVKIARRTIAKYRKELDIMSSYHRQ
jgi:RNA polymerase sigma-54 factor